MTGMAKMTEKAPFDEWWEALPPLSGTLVTQDFIERYARMGWNARKALDMQLGNDVSKTLEGEKAIGALMAVTAIART